MSKCDLSIELESGAVRHQPGDVVRGHVLVDVNDVCTCKNLNIALQWRTHGRGNRDKGEPLRQTLFEGVWRPDEQPRYPFEFTVPTGPLSYRGKVLNIDWYITARADIPWAFDPKAETEIFVHHGSYTGPLSVGNDRKHQQLQQWQSKARGVLSTRAGLVTCVLLGMAAVFLVPMLCMGIGAVIWGILEVRKDPSTGNILLLTIGSVFTLLPAIILVIFLRWRQMRRKLGNVQVAAEAANMDAGTKIFCAITFTPQASVVLNRISADLVGQEIAVSGSGTTSYTYTEEFHRENRELRSAQQLVPGNPVEEIVEFDLPADAPATFFARSNQFTWQVDVKVDIPGWPDYNDKVEITVPA
ncbi:MAG: hypothetical protein QGF67_09085 [Lentisphaeria bacterium]|jgi:hypothetical protein|nr:hypothetical protein [Lentisphaeria bacterium]